MKRSFLFVALWLLSGSVAQAEPTTILVSLEPYRYFVERIGGDNVSVQALVPRNADPHTYEPTLDRLFQVSKARVYFSVGHRALELEKRWIDFVHQENPALEVINTADSVELLRSDPHLWLSLANARTISGVISKALLRILPEKSAVIQANTTQLFADLDALDTALRSSFSKCKARRFYVFHPSWTYFAREYGLEQVAVENEGKEPDPFTLAAIIREAKARNTRSVFSEPLLSRASTERFAEELGARVEMLDPLSGNWLENIRTSAGKIREALACDTDS